MEGTTFKKILVVEDEVSLARAIELKFEKLRIGKVIVTQTAEEALVVLEEDGENIGVIWLDLRLPRMDGLEFLKRIRSSERFKYIPVVVVSASGTPDTMERAHALGVSDYIVKSDVQLQDIITRVAGIAERSEKETA